jgi:mannose-1-phosphate guanylyltransferase
VILAGGDGVRLQPLTRLICGDDRPKQFCPLFDGCTLLGHTICRAERSIPDEQILFALTHKHRDFYAHELDGFESQRIVQPANKGTAPPILFSILSIEKMDEDALIAFIPSDHYYPDEACFTAVLESAFEAAEEHPQSVVLVGAQPTYPEVEYGWISLGAAIGHDSGNRTNELYRVRGFLEKPSLDVAQTLLGEHSAWNTFVMVGHVRAFREMVTQAVPDLLEGVRRAPLWSGSETYIEESVYNQVLSADFSKQVLSPEAVRLLVLRARDLGWSDLGHPGRVLAVLEESGTKPRWWTKELRKGMAVAATPRPESAVA